MFATGLLTLQTMFVGAGPVAGIIHVPADYPTIQAAINASDHLDTVIVAPGTYNEAIDFGGKLITLTSTNPTDPQVVAATVLGRGVRFAGTEVSLAKLVGFTITGPNFGIFGNNSTATIRNCVVTRVHGDGDAAGIIYSHGLIENCMIQNNDVYGIKYCNGTIRNCVISGNNSVRPSQGNTPPGSGLHYCNATIANCTVVGNRDGGLYRCQNRTIRNCIIWGNNGGQIEDSSSVLTYSLIQGGAAGTGNIALDPRFSIAGYQNACLWVDGDYRLAPDSPAIDAGDPAFVPAADERDLDGGPRVINGRVDMGAYEYPFVGCDRDFDGDGTPDCLDTDIDNDGVPNGLDVCGETPLGVAVDSEGRPFADLTHDCIVDLRDFAIFQNSMIGP